MAEKTSLSGQFVVTAPPYWHCGRTISSTNGIVLISLIPAALMAVNSWGVHAASVMSLAVLAGMATEILCEKMMRREIRVNDLSTAVSCLVLAFLLPAETPWWAAALGAILSVSLGKMAFGGIGNSPVNTALVGWAMLSVSWPLIADPNAMQLATSWVDPLVRLKYFGVNGIEEIELWDLLLGHQIGGLGASQVGLILLAGLWLTAKGYLRWEIAFSFLAGVFLTASAYWIADPSQFASPMFHILAGSTMLGAFFLATDDASSPMRPAAQICYGLTGGILVILIRSHSIYADGVPFAILLINLLAPQFDALLSGKPFGAR